MFHRLPEVVVRGHIIAEDRFLHLGTDHHLFVTEIENEENEFRFKVTRIPPGGAALETVFEKLVNFSPELAQRPDTTIDQLITSELAVIRNAVFADEDLHVHDP
jgi:hypothetical protein